MVEIVNLRTARKRAQRNKAAAQAETNRVVHGLPKQIRQREAALKTKAAHDLDAHRIDKKDGR